jgi:hypothetical protein
VTASATIAFWSIAASAGPTRSIDSVARNDALVAYVRAHTDPGDTVAVIGWGGETYFYGRQPALTYTQVMPYLNWMTPRIRADVERQIAVKRPRLVVFSDETCCAVALPADYGGAAGGPKPDELHDTGRGVGYFIYTRH